MIPRYNVYTYDIRWDKPKPILSSSLNSEKSDTGKWCRYEDVQKLIDDVQELVDNINQLQQVVHKLETTNNYT